ncbi:hypothetical protein [Cellvibrio sp. UBA7661]|uniref:hypothetical protein n=1 Tax=Cellvibrio sp. UBA7661 TaxID=1946311 RepID=UPI002F35B29D
MKTVFAVLRSKGVKVAAAGSALMVATTAAHADMATEIAAAQTAGEGNVTLAIAAVIGICALVMGLNVVISLLKK